MAASLRGGAVVGLCLMAMVMVMVMVMVGSIGAEAQLSTNLTTDFYDDKCPQIYDIVKEEIRKAVAAEPRNAASLVRLHFHDCFVQGCDGSILLNSTDDFVSEQLSIPNNDSIRGFPVIDAIKAKLEDACPQTVSCADIVAIASRDSAVAAGLSYGYPVFFGRRDSLKPASNLTVLQSLPAPTLNFTELKQNFNKTGLNVVDLVTLSGAHTFGRTHCRTLNISQIRFNTTVGFDPVFHANNLKACNGNAEKLENLDHTTPDKFDNLYYKNLLKGQTNFVSDQVLISTPGDNQKLVKYFAANPWAFAKQFGLSTIKMGNIKPLIGHEGEIRKHCAFVNDASSSKGSAASLVASQ